MGGAPSRPRGDFSPEALAKTPQPYESDPDFGWRELKEEVRSLHADPSLPEYGNERSGVTCQAQAVVIGINLATRSTALAEKFGIFGNEQQQSLHESTKGRTDSQYGKIYELLRVPDMGWRLVDMVFGDGGKAEGGGCACFGGGAKSPPAASRSGAKGGQGGGKKEGEDTPYVATVSRMYRDGKTYTANIGCLGMNTHEQLKRLEKNTDKKNALPVDAFGWELTGGQKGNAVEVVPPPDVAARAGFNGNVWVIPEELILNVMEWVRFTYYTQPPDMMMDAAGLAEKKAQVEALNRERQAKAQQGKPIAFGTERR